ncbi:hypothetical protein PR048_029547 [Dryococelus australis]|uniref:Uncharacterized protein n=1 Tax=Dryococelus australis TaxID=614101 RepID=A0ABQ9GGA0_9NEOP|nr:hypothetical protein PR048_029547 [Dryococelus australis]
MPAVQTERRITNAEIKHGHHLLSMDKVVSARSEIAAVELKMYASPLKRRAVNISELKRKLIHSEFITDKVQQQQKKKKTLALALESNHKNSGNEKQSERISCHAFRKKKHFGVNSTYEFRIATCPLERMEMVSVGQWSKQKPIIKQLVNQHQPECISTYHRPIGPGYTGHAYWALQRLLLADRRPMKSRVDCAPINIKLTRELTERFREIYGKSVYENQYVRKFMESLRTLLDKFLPALFRKMKEKFFLDSEPVAISDSHGRCGVSALDDARHYSAASLFMAERCRTQTSFAVDRTWQSSEISPRDIKTNKKKKGQQRKEKKNRRLHLKIFLQGSNHRLNPEGQRKAFAGETEDIRENPPTSGIVRHDSHLRKSGSADRHAKAITPHSPASLMVTRNSRNISPLAAFPPQDYQPSSFPGPSFTAGKLVTSTLPGATITVPRVVMDAVWRKGCGGGANWSNVRASRASSAAHALKMRQTERPSFRASPRRWPENRQSNCQNYLFKQRTHQSQRFRGGGATVAERLACSPPTTAIRVQSPARFSHVGIVPVDAVGRRVFSGSPVSPAPSITRIGSQDHDKSRPNLFTHSLTKIQCWSYQILSGCLGLKQLPMEHCTRLYNCLWSTAPDYTTAYGALHPTIQREELVNKGLQRQSIAVCRRNVSYILAHVECASASYWKTCWVICGRYRVVVVIFSQLSKQRAAFTPQVKKEVPAKGKRGRRRSSKSVAPTKTTPAGGRKNLWTPCCNTSRPTRNLRFQALQTRLFMFHAVLYAGATVAEQLACSPPTKAIRVQSPAGSLRIFACENCARRCRWSAGFVGDLPSLPISRQLKKFVSSMTRRLDSTVLRTNMPISTAHWLSAVTVEGDDWANLLQEVSKHRRPWWSVQDGDYGEINRLAMFSSAPSSLQCFRRLQRRFSSYGRPRTYALFCLFLAKIIRQALVRWTIFVADVSQYTESLHLWTRLCATVADHGGKKHVLITWERAFPKVRDANRTWLHCDVQSCVLFAFEEAPTATPARMTCVNLALAVRYREEKYETESGRCSSRVGSYRGKGELSFEIWHAHSNEVFGVDESAVIWKASAKVRSGTAGSRPRIALAQNTYKYRNETAARGDKIDVKHVYTEVDFAIGSQFIRHALDDSEPIADLQGNK